MRHATRTFPSLRPAALALALCAGLSACGDHGATGAEAGEAPAAGALSEAEVAAEVAATLRACSYDGAPVDLREDVLGTQPPRDCADMVERIMGFTGLPPNFVVGEAPIPNAAATILLDAQRIPHRVIAFNPRFIDEVGRATGSAVWAPMSIMAHEIGHHLSGHTITAGGSQPPIELEADKFSGFVLYKMGAPLAEASRAIETIVPLQDGPTHPGRERRVAAVREGWMQACEQQGGQDCAALAAAATRPETPPPSGPAPAAGPDRLPRVDPAGLPAKQGRFVVDESGLLDAGLRAQLEQRLYEHARDNGVEVVLLLVNDLQGLSADDFAWAMMRQLRVGKLDTGNGAVLVVAPGQKQAGVAMGPGVALAMEHFTPGQQIQSWIEQGWPVCVQQQGCGRWTENLFMTPQRVVAQTADLDWTIRYQRLGDFRTAAAAYSKQRIEQGGEYRRDQDPIYRHLVRFEGTVQNLDTPVGVTGVAPEILAIGPIVERRGKRPIHVKSDDGFDAIVYLDPRTVPLMPAGLPEVGQRYTLVGRVERPAALEAHPDHLHLLSWERLD